MGASRKIGRAKRSMFVLAAGVGLVVALTPSPSPAIELCPQSTGNIWTNIDRGMDRWVPVWKTKTPNGCIQIIGDI